jgi:hypothetical protein
MGPLSFPDANRRRRGINVISTSTTISTVLLFKTKPKQSNNKKLKLKNLSTASSSFSSNSFLSLIAFLGRVCVCEKWCVELEELFDEFLRINLDKSTKGLNTTTTTTTTSFEKQVFLQQFLKIRFLLFYWLVGASDIARSCCSSSYPIHSSYSRKKIITSLCRRFHCLGPPPEGEPDCQPPYAIPSSGHDQKGLDNNSQQQ